MAKPNWGVKRMCQSCGARFYDLAKDPILCPKCGAEFDPEAILKTKRAKPAAQPRPVPVVPVAAEEEIEPIGEEVAKGAEDDKEEEVIEDTSELGEDDEDVAEVRDNVDEEER